MQPIFGTVLLNSVVIVFTFLLTASMSDAVEFILSLFKEVFILPVKVFMLCETVPKIGCTVQEINRVLCNVEEMTAGLNRTMKKPFGGLRLIFGSPIGKNVNN